MLEESYAKEKRRKRAMIAAACGAVLAMGYGFVTIGMDAAGPWQLFIALRSLFAGTLETGADAAVNKIILLLRLPRIALACIAGAGLAMSGAVMQSVARNALVSPFTLGISSAAAFGASVCIVFGTGAFLESDIGMIVCAFTASLGCGAAVYAIARRVALTPGSLVLVGIALNYLFGALTATIEFFAKEHRLEAVVQWTFGTLNRADWDAVLLTGPAVLFCGLALTRYALPLNAMASSGDETVRSLGVLPERVRTRCGLLAILMTAAVISFTGVIGFVGLIAPHMARFLIGCDHRFYLPFAAALGAGLLLAADTAGKLILYPVNIPVGIVVSFLGVPLFVHLILARRRGAEG